MPRIDEFLKRDSYRAKLQTSAWKSFSTQIKNERGNCCEMCKRTGLILHLHHLFYDPNTEPWDYPGSAVVVLCAGCHAETHDELRAFRRFVFGKLNPQSFRVLNGALAVAMTEHDPLVFAHALAEFVSTPGMIRRFADAWGIDIKKKKGRDYKQDCDITAARAELVGIKTRLEEALKKRTKHP